MKQTCIDKICNLPITFKQGDKSLNTLLTESKFQLLHKEISTYDIINYLQMHQDLLDIWKQYSDDKRTSGGFYYRSKYISSIEDLTCDKTFSSDTEACAEYIIKETSFWLHINNE